MKRSPLKRGTKPLKRTELKRGESQLTRTRFTTKRTPAAQAHMDRMDDLRPKVLARNGGRCEIDSPGCTGRATVPHHRQPTGGGGPDTEENLVASCHDCHTLSPAAVHRNIDWAMGVGLLISRHAQAPTERWEQP